MSSKNNTKKLVRLALFAAIALTVFIVEAQLPSPVIYIPGMKLGLSNVVTVVLLHTHSKRDALSVLLVRIFLGSFFAGQMAALIYSLAGGLLSFIFMCIAVKVFGKENTWFTGVTGGVFHNIGQIFAARVLMDTSAVFAYLPYLVLFGIGTGLFCGICAGLCIKHLKKLQYSQNSGSKKT